MKRPCIRGLKKFEDGCPEMEFNPNTGMGCPAWIIDIVIENNTKKPNGECIEWWKMFYHKCALRLIEGVQVATEGNRNMTGLLSLTLTRQAQPSELIRIANKHLKEGGITIKEIENRNAED